MKRVTKTLKLLTKYKKGKLSPNERRKYYHKLISSKLNEIGINVKKGI